MPLCSECMEWFIVPSRIVKMCRDCEAHAIAEAAKQVDERSLNISELANWVQSGERPHKLIRVWWCW